MGLLRSSGKKAIGTITTATKNNTRQSASPVRNQESELLVGVPKTKTNNQDAPWDEELQTDDAASGIIGNAKDSVQCLDWMIRHRTCTGNEIPSCCKSTGRNEVFVD